MHWEGAVAEVQGHSEMGGGEEEVSLSYSSQGLCLASLDWNYYSFCPLDL
jgi:hypothetical protein